MGQHLLWKVKDGSDKDALVLVEDAGDVVSFDFADTDGRRARFCSTREEFEEFARAVLGGAHDLGELPERVKAWWED